MQPGCVSVDDDMLVAAPATRRKANPQKKFLNPRKKDKKSFKRRSPLRPRLAVVRMAID